MSNLFACVDVGTTRVKLNVYDEEMYKQYSEYATVPVENGLQDAEELYRVVKHLLDKAIEVGAKSAGLATYRASTVSWNKDGKPLTPIVTWTDTSAGEIFHKLPSWVKLLGKVPPLDLILSPFSPLMRFLRVKELDGNDPQPSMVWTVDSYLAYRFTGRFVSDATNACMTGLVDPRSLKPIGIVDKILGLHVQTPEVVGNTERIGTYNGIELNGIIADQQAAAVAEGALKPGVAKVTNGTGTFVDVPVDGFRRRGELIPIVLLKHRGACYYGVEGYMPTTGLAVDRLIRMGIIRNYEELEVEQKGSLFFMPALAGMIVPREPDVRGTIYGLDLGLDTNTLVSGLLDSLAFFAKMVLEQSGEAPRLVRVNGGLSRSNQLCRRIANATGLNVQRNRDLEATSRGLAMLQMISVGKLTLEEVLKEKTSGGVAEAGPWGGSAKIHGEVQGVDIFSSTPSPELEERYRKWLKELEWLKSSKNYFPAG